MKLTSIQIFKYLPGGKKNKKANCKECGFATCMAFALMVVRGKTEITNCKYVDKNLIKKVNFAMQNTKHKTAKHLKNQQSFQVKPKVYKVGNTNNKSPILITTNFALSYSAVFNELKEHNISCFILATNSGGMSVLTAHLAGKFNTNLIIKELNKNFSKDELIERPIILPGCVDNLLKEIQFNMPKSKILTGPMEANKLHEFLLNC